MPNAADWYIPGRSCVSPYNFMEEATGRIPSNVTICESTLREIHLTPGVPQPAVDDIVAIASLLDEMGVTLVGCHHSEPGASLDSVEAIAKRGFRFKLLSTFKDAGGGRKELEARVDQLADSGIDLLIAAVLVSDGRVRPQAAGSIQQQLSAALTVMEHAKQRGIESGISLSDFSRQSDLGQLCDCAKVAADAGADLVLLGDSRGCLAPRAVPYVVGQVRSCLPAGLPVIYHVHNDFGLAVPLAIEAALEGCIPDLFVYGVGELPEPDLAQVVVGLDAMYGISTGLQLEKLTDLYRLVARVSGIAPPPQQPVVGSNWYTPLSGIAYVELNEGHDMLRNENTRGFHPSLVGQEPVLRWWHNMATGPAVASKLQRMGLPSDGRLVESVTEAIQERLRAIRDYPAYLTEDEVAEICSRVAFDAG